MEMSSVSAPITKYLMAKAVRQKIPLSGIFELTPLCNMNCRMCYVRMNREEQEKIAPLGTVEQWLEVGKEARDSGMLYLLLTGGEPFLRKDFREIYQGLYDLGIIIEINSNGTLIDEQTVAWLREVPPQRINITLYGASDVTYGRLCRNPKGFTQVSRAIRLLKEARINVRLNCSVTPYNADDLEDIFAFGRREYIPVRAASYMYPPVRRDASSVGVNDRFSPEEAAYYDARIKAYSLGDEKFLEWADRNENILPELNDDICGEMKAEGIRCHAGRSSFWITWNGCMVPCGMFRGEEEHNVFQEGFTKNWKRVLEETARIRLAPECGACAKRDICKSCAAMEITENGKFGNIPEYRCQMVKTMPDAVRKVKQEILEERRKCNE